MNRHSKKDDEGFTLVELLISVTISAIILAALGTSIIVFLRNAYDTSKRTEHDSGADVLGTYIQRDLASATSAPTAGGTSCSSVTNAMTMSWKPYTATDASPQPVVGSTTYTAAYAVRPDPHYTSPARFEVERWYCENSTLLAHNVVAGNLATSDFSFTAPVVNTTKCPTGGQVVTVSLNHYQTDTAISAYSYQGCLNGRVR